MLTDFGAADDSVRRARGSPDVPPHAAARVPCFTGHGADRPVARRHPWVPAPHRRSARPQDRRTYGRLELPHRLGLEVPMGLSRAIMEGLKPEPAERPESAERMLERVRSVPIHAGWHDVKPSDPAVVRAWRADGAGGGRDRADPTADTRLRGHGCRPARFASAPRATSDLRHPGGREPGGASVAGAGRQRHTALARPRAVGVRRHVLPGVLQPPVGEGAAVAVVAVSLEAQQHQRATTVPPGDATSCSRSPRLQSGRAGPGRHGRTRRPPGGRCGPRERALRRTGSPSVRSAGTQRGVPRLIRTRVTPGGSASSAARQLHVNSRGRGRLTLSLRLGHHRWASPV